MSWGVSSCEQNSEVDLQDLLSMNSHPLAIALFRGGRRKSLKSNAYFSSSIVSAVPIEKYLCKGSCVLKHENNLIAIYKPPHVLSQPQNIDLSTSTEHKINIDVKKKVSVITLPYDNENEYYYDDNQKNSNDVKVKFWLLHRLDAETSGILLLSCDEHVASEVKRLFSIGKIEKKYHAIVFGEWTSKKQESWITPLIVKKYKNRVMTEINTQTLRGRLARTKVRVIKRIVLRKIMLLELLPKTGITHQLRVQCQHEKVPIVGDRIYGDFKKNKAYRNLGEIQNRLYLHASKLVVPLELLRQTDAQICKKITFEVTSHLPSSFVDLMKL